MFQNYFKTAWRNLTVSKFYSLINVSGLAVGLTTGIMLLMWVQNEFSYDKFIHDYKHIYKFSTHFISNGKAVDWNSVPGPLAVYSHSMPQVKSIVRIASDWNQVFSDMQHHKILGGFHIAYADSTFFRMFNFKLLEGSEANLSPNNNSVVLTQSTAKKMFGNKDALGKVIIYNNNNFAVTGILKDFPENSSVQYDAIFPMGYYAAQFTANGGNGQWKTIDEDLGDYAFNTFVQLAPGANSEKIASEFTAIFKKASHDDVSFPLENLADVHLIEPDGNTSALRMVQIFALIAILLLLIAGINYVNLSTARSMIRVKEVSIRKIVGASRRQLFSQFIIETVLLFCIATAIAILLIYLLMPLYNNISGKDIQFSLADAQVWKVIAIAITGTLIASSIYPAIILSAFHPLDALKGKISSGIGAALFRKILVVFQFTISVILIVSTLVISKQMHYMRNKDLGYDKSYVFTVSLPDQVVSHIDAFKNELNSHPGILNVSVSNIHDITNFTAATGYFSWPGEPANSNFIICQASIDYQFIPTMKMHLLEGNNFSGTPADSNHYILNEAAVKAMGLEPPYVGQPITFHKLKGIITGVVKDFNFRPLDNRVTPLIFFSWGGKNILYVRTTAADAQQAIAAVKKQYQKYASYIPFTYNFIDRQFAAKYESDQREGTLFNLFAAIAIFISCLGLLGLATFTAQRRMKEIGVRKVLGASVGNLIRLVSVDFLKLVIIAIVIAIPVGWFVMNKWLENFAYKTDISWWIFLAAAAIAILIAVLTVSFQAIRAAVANPVEALRSE
ncbi:MAG: FtsX-like permease family protein [Chitinophagaceae bacterium]|nr:MAG: FtsX-like permease family protein [Chitinophagaceae bacterium]